MNLTAKQRLFIKHLIRTFSPTEAAMQSYDCKDRLSARNIASENLSKLGIDMNNLMEKTGLGLEEDVEDLKRLRKCKRPIACDIFIRDENGELKVNKNSNDWVEVDDNPSQLKALEITLKLKGHLKDKLIDQSHHHTLQIVNYGETKRIDNPNTSQRIPAA